MKIGFGKYLRERLALLIMMLLSSIAAVALALSFSERGFRLGVLCVVMLPTAVLIGLYGVCYLRRQRFFRRLDTAISKDEDEVDPTLCINFIRDSHWVGDQVYGYVVERMTEVIRKQYADELKASKNCLDYTQKWMHDIKNPIAAIRLLCEKNTSETSMNIMVKLDEVNSYVEKILGVSKYVMEESFYMLGKLSLEETVQNAVLHSKNSLIMKKIRLNVHDVDVEVYSYGRWLEYIICQMLLNSIVYRRSEDPEIEIYSELINGERQLVILDNGVGIKKAELGKIFDENFVGTNDVHNSNATGMGLYLCARMAEKIGHRLRAESEYGAYTKMQIVFPVKPE